MSASTDAGRTPRPDDDSAGAGSRPRMPDSVKIATELWIAVIVAQTVAFFARYPTMRDLWDRQVVREVQAGAPAAQVDMMSSAWILIATMIIIVVIPVAVSVTVVFFTRRGYNWARLVLGAMGIYVFLSLLFGIFGDVEPQWAMIPQVISGVAALGATILLMRRDSDTYCREMAEYRRPKPVTPAYPPSAPWSHPGQQLGQPYPPGTYPGSYPPGSYPTYPSPSYPSPTYPSPTYPSPTYPSPGDPYSGNQPYPPPYPPGAYPPGEYQPGQYPSGTYPPSAPPESGARSESGDSGEAAQGGGTGDVTPGASGTTKAPSTTETSGAPSTTEAPDAPNSAQAAPGPTAADEPDPDSRTSDTPRNEGTPRDQS
ncbi:hypothetical protein GCM10009624_00780 [Gordonia sinesedis]